MPRNNEDFTNGQEKLDATVRGMGLGRDMIKDPDTGTVYVDLSDPKHPFHQPMFPDWDKKDGDK